ncbi:BON domain-containing protein [Paraburkholderia phymatum]|uniref:Transport-associated n=1 Tax=Paraburkholderia phymatum (strain DSM 17167 / CIP 108236 / LMG 21445 / STM815) TaxID=391038 RepID=B2JLA6_PARP8|nr:BON domain-containing protein [Paraburkholderia phymatum]ACC74074.1 transport-associated [Paraburkholderia phymatum STM815]
MNVIRTLALVGGTLIVATSINAWPQTSEPATPSTQSSHTSKQANRALSKNVLHTLSKGGVKTSGINVVAKGGAVVLEGSVPDPAQIDKAGELAKGVQGVTSVKNSLTVKEAGQ